MPKTARRLLSTCLLSLGIAACGPRGGGSGVDRKPSLGPGLSQTAPAFSSERITDPWRKQWWIAKVASSLSGGERRLSAAEVAALVPLTEDQVIDHFMDTPALGLAALRFHLFWLGQERNELKNNEGAWLQAPMTSAPSAYAAAAALVDRKPGYFDALMSYRQPMYLARLGNYFGGRPTPEEMALKRQEEFDKIIVELRALRDEADATSPEWPPDLCPRLRNVIFAGAFPWDKHFPEPIRMEGEISPDWFASKLSRLFGCRLNPPPAPKPYPGLVAELDALIAKYEAIFDRLRAFEPKDYNPRNVHELRAIEVSDLGLQLKFFNIRLRNDLANTSTSFNRKRAAYVLRQFFCDDLTPVAVQQPPQHAGNQHGSDPACMACHYKLDPMAGYFKTLGSGFRDYSQSAKIVFEDGPQLDRARYEASWAAPPGAPYGPWNIAYIRSAENWKENQPYGRGIEDLFTVLRSAPEVKQCFVRRMFQHFVSPRMLVEEGYIAAAASEFEALSKTDSGQAFRTTLRKFLKSGAYKAINPDPGQCYDSAPGYDPAKSPPCAIAYIVRNRCVSCHDSVEHAIDFREWKTLPDGATGFRHLGQDGRELGRKESFRLILERLADPDPQKRMPKARTMPDPERETLFHWLERNS